MEAHATMGATLSGLAAYLLGVALLEALFLAATGQGMSEVSQLTLVSSTLVFAASLHPLRLRLIDRVERRLREREALRAAGEGRMPPQR